MALLLKIDDFELLCPREGQIPNYEFSDEILNILKFLDFFDFGRLEARIHDFTIGICTV